MNIETSFENPSLTETYINTCPSGLAISEDGKIIKVNQLLCDLLQVSPNEILGKSIEKYVSQEDRKKLEPLEALSNKENESIAASFVDSKKNKVDCDVKGQTLQIEDKTYCFYYLDRRKSNQITSETLNALLTRMADVKAETIFESTVSILSDVLDFHYVFIGIYDKESNEITIRAMGIDGEMQSPFSYNVSNTPCGEVINNGCCLSGTSTQEKYPEDFYLVDWRVESYVGVSLKNSERETIGHLAVMDTKPIENTELVSSMLSIFAHRLGLEMELEQREKDAQSSQDRYRNVFNNSFEAKIIYDKSQEKIIDVNEAAVELFQYKRNQFKKVELSDLKPSYLEDAMLNNARSLEEGKKVIVQSVGKKADGSYFETDVAYTVFDEEENLIIISYRDVSETKKAIDKLKVSESRFRSLFDFSFDAIFLYNIEKNIYENCNERAAELFGFTKKELIGKTPEDLVSEIQKNFIKRDDALKTQKKVLKQNKKLHFEFNFKKADGTIFEAEVSLLPTKEKSRNYCIVVINDISQNKRYERVLKDRQKFLKTIIDLNPNLVYAKDRDLRFTLANQATGDFLGVPPEQLIGKRWEDFCKVASERNRIQKTDLQIIDSKEPLQVSAETLTCAKKEKHYMQTSKLPILNSAGEVEVILSVSTDITPHITTENKLKESNNSLKKVNNELDHFVYRASHDLRAPLASILGLTNLVRFEKSVKGMLKYNDFVEAQVKKLDGFIKEIIDYSKVSRTEVQVENIDFEKLLNEIFESLKYLEQCKQIKREFSLKKDADFYSDNRTLNIIFKNLISNSIKYSDSKKPNSFINFSVEINEESASIILEDNGIGIEEEQVPKIFNMFHRATESSDGSGLGLFIVKQSLEKLGGDILVESEHKKQTKFVVTIPNSIK
ncbi:MAG: PAS domain S-box protein [Bacteroidota bacterium]